MTGRLGASASRLLPETAGEVGGGDGPLGLHTVEELSKLEPKGASELPHHTHILVCPSVLHKLNAYCIPSWNRRSEVGAEEWVLSRDSREVRRF